MKFWPRRWVWQSLRSGHSPRVIFTWRWKVWSRTWLKSTKKPWTCCKRKMPRWELNLSLGGPEGIAMSSVKLFWIDMIHTWGQKTPRIRAEPTWASLDPWTAICVHWQHWQTLTITACSPRPRLLYRYQQLHPEDHVPEEREQLCSLSTILVSSNVSNVFHVFPRLLS